MAWLAVAVLGLTGCAHASAGTAPVSEGPAKVEAVEGADVSTVELSDEAFGRLGIETATVRALPAAVSAGADAAGPPSLGVPTAALVYDRGGRTWVFVAREQRVFVREAVTVSRVSGDLVVLQSGPPAGTPVVVVGGAELLGAEYGVAGE